MDRKGLDG